MSQSDGRRWPSKTTIFRLLNRRPTICCVSPDRLGAAIVVDGKATLVGSTPDQETVLALAQWLASSTTGVYATDALSQAWPRASRHTDTASGILAVPISQIFRNYVIWFRPETTRTITWAGEPVKRVSSQDGSVAPRKDFAPWLETVRNRSHALASGGTGNCG